MKNELFVSACADAEIRVYDESRNGLSESVRIPVEEGPRCIVFHPLHPLAYVSTQQGPVVVLDLRNDVQPTRVCTLETGGRMCFLHLEGRLLIGTSYATGCVQSWVLGEDGLPTGAGMRMDAGLYAHCVCFAGDGRTFFIPHPETKLMNVMRACPDGSLEHVRDNPMPRDIRHLRRVQDVYYGIAFLEHSLCRFRQTGDMLELMDECPLSDGQAYPETSGSELHFHPRLPVVYAASRGQNTLTALRLGENGLQPLARIPVDDEPVSFCLSARQNCLYIAGKNGMRVEAVKLRAVDGVPCAYRFVPSGKEILWLEMR